jgi:hydroxyacylglutathione hydrolase
MELIALPAFADNYIWMLHDGRRALVVDPGDAVPVQEALGQRHLELAAILVTHHHGDHVGGLAALAPLCTGPIYGPAHETMPIDVIPVVEGMHFDLLGLRFATLDVPGHTAGHVAYVAHPASGAPWLFCGDTLFSGGCGRLFEGTPAQMHESLSKFAALPAATQVCCTHEYTLANLRFARAVEPSNRALVDYEVRCTDLRAHGHITLPSTVANERAINPFLRTQEPEVIASALAHGAASRAPVDVLAALREWKNHTR